MSVNFWEDLLIFLCFCILVERSKACKLMSSNIVTNDSSSATIDLLPNGKCCLVKVIACILCIFKLFTITELDCTTALL